MSAGSGFSLGIGLLFLAAGCASVPPARTQNARELEIDQLVMTVDPLTAKSDVKKTFKINLLDRGVLPIKLTAQNRSPATSFIIAKDKVLVMNETTCATNASGEVAREIGTWSRGKQLATAGAFAVATPAVVGVPVFLMAAMRPTEGAFVFKPTEERLSGKEFQTRTLGPGQSADGFIYFRLPDHIDPTNSYHVVAEIKNLSTGEMIPFDIKVNLNL